MSDGKSYGHGAENMIPLERMDGQTQKAILKALSDGMRIEMLRDKDGNIIVQTIQRKRLKI